MPIVAVIGLDGSGKTTQAKLLVQKLKESGIAARCVRPDYVLVELLNSLIRSNMERLLPSPRQRRAGPVGDSKRRRRKWEAVKGFIMGILGYLYAWICYTIVVFSSRGGRVVVCDRYFYQFFYDLYGPYSQKIARFFPKPNLAYFMDGSLELFRARMTNPFDKEVSTQYYDEVRSLFVRLSQIYGFIIVDASQDAASINEFIFSHCYGKLRRIKRGGI